MARVRTTEYGKRGPTEFVDPPPTDDGDAVIVDSNQMLGHIASQDERMEGDGYFLGGADGVSFATGRYKKKVPYVCACDIPGHHG